jgi:hypothetical protein
MGEGQEFCLRPFALFRNKLMKRVSPLRATLDETERVRELIDKPIFTDLPHHGREDDKSRPVRCR